MIRYEIKGRRYYKDGNSILKEQALKELTSSQFSKLLTNGKCNIRKPKIKLGVMTKRDLKLIEKVRDKYIAVSMSYVHKGLKYELWKKNPKGYNNFVCYIDDLSPSTIDNAILNHIKNFKNN